MLLQIIVFCSYDQYLAKDQCCCNLRASAYDLDLEDQGRILFPKVEGSCAGTGQNQLTTINCW